MVKEKPDNLFFPWLFDRMVKPWHNNKKLKNVGEGWEPQHAMHYIIFSNNYRIELESSFYLIFFQQA